MSTFLIYDSTNLKDYQKMYQGLFVNASNGKLGLYSSYATSYVRVNPGDIVNLEGTFTQNVGAFYDSSLTYVSGINTKDNISVPENAKYIRIGGGLPLKINITSDNISDLGNETYKDEIIFDSLNTELSLLADNTINFNNGTFLSSTGHTCTEDYISVTPSDNFIILGSVPTSCGAVYDESDGYVSKIAGTNNATEISVDTPSNGYKIRFGWRTSANSYLIKMTKENVDISGGEESVTYTITNNLTNVTNNNNSSNIEENSNYSTTLTADSGYSLSTVTVTMGGNDITSSVYSDGSINIPNVTGDIIITASATQTTTSKTLSSISAVYNQGSTTVYPSTSLDSLKSNLTVTATYSDSTNSTLSSSSYSLSGKLSVGTSTITVTYSGKTTTFNVTVTEEVEAPITTNSNNVILTDCVRKGIKTLIFDSNSKNVYRNYTNYYIDYRNGDIIPSNEYGATAFINVQPGDIIEVEGQFPPSSGALYNSDKYFVEGLSKKGESSYSLTISDNVYFIRLSYVMSKQCKIYLTRNSANYSLVNDTYLDFNKLLYGNNVLSKDIILGLKYQNKLKRKTWDVYGDSITEYNYRTYLNYHGFVSEILDLGTIRNYGVTNYTFKDVANKITETSTSADIVTVFCGTNNFGEVGGTIQLGDVTDTSSTDTVCGHIKLCIENLLNRYPETLIGFITPLPRANGNSVQNQTNKAGFTLENLVDKIIEICGKYSIPVLDLYRTSNLRPWIASNNAKYFSCRQSTGGDGLHPNVLGHEQIAPKIAEFLKTL